MGKAQLVSPMGGKRKSETGDGSKKKDAKTVKVKAESVGKSDQPQIEIFEQWLQPDRTCDVLVFKACAE